MSIAALSSARQFSVPDTLNRLFQSLGSNPPSLDKTSPVTTSNALTNTNNDSVSLSPQGLAQQKDELAKDAEILGKLTRESLSVLSPDLGGAQITFDQLTYSKSSNVSLRQDGNSTAFHSDREESISGSGHITTADGRVLNFTAELDVAQSLDLSQTGNVNPAGGQNTGIVPPDRAQGAGFALPPVEQQPDALTANDLAAANLGAALSAIQANASDNPLAQLLKPAASKTPAPAQQPISLHLPKLDDLAKAGQQLLDLLRELNPVSTPANPDASNGTAPGTAPSAPADAQKIAASA